jgi:hypothetical protein
MRAQLRELGVEVVEFLLDGVFGHFILPNYDTCTAIASP